MPLPPTFWDTWQEPDYRTVAAFPSSPFAPRLTGDRVPFETLVQLLSSDDDEVLSALSRYAQRNGQGCKKKMLSGRETFKLNDALRRIAFLVRIRLRGSPSFRFQRLERNLGAVRWQFAPSLNFRFCSTRLVIGWMRLPSRHVERPRGGRGATRPNISSDRSSEFGRR
jgi:hypothetical protein